MTSPRRLDGRLLRVAVGLGVIGAGLAVAQLALIVMTWSHPGVDTWNPRDIALLQTTTGVAMATVGFVVVANRGDSIVGWLLLVGGVADLGWWMTNEYAVWGGVVAPGSLPGASAAGLLSDRLWVLPMGCLTLIVLVFPTGRLLGPAWWPAAWSAALAMALVVPSIASVWHLRTVWQGVGDDPTTVLPAAARAIDLMVTICLYAGLVAAVASLAVRWRRSRGIERLQLKWLLFAAAITAITSGIDVLVERRWARVLLVMAVLTIPIAVGVAVLRHRLYEIDRIIRRTVTYALVTALTIAVFAVVAVLPTVVLGLDSDVFVAAATLSAAGVARPLHARTRNAVDRRFNRAHYDADTTVRDFASRVRDDTDVDDLVREVLHVLRGTLEPTSAALLLRGPAGTYRALPSALGAASLQQPAGA